MENNEKRDYIPNQAIPKEDLKNLFENGDIPSQEDFWQWQDSYWHKNDPIDIIPSERVDMSNKADKNATNLDGENIANWRTKLNIEKIDQDNIPRVIQVSLQELDMTPQNSKEEVEQALSTFIVNKNITVGEKELYYFQITGYPDSGGGETAIEENTLDSVVKIDNYSSKYITFTRGTYNGKSFDRDGALGVNPNTYSFYFGNMNPNHTGNNNMSFGFDSLPELTAGERNISVGAYSQSKVTTNSNNSSLGYYSFNALIGGDSNVAVGNSAGEKVTQSHGSVYVGSLSGFNLTDRVITVEDVDTISPILSSYLKDPAFRVMSGYKDGDTTFKNAVNTFVGAYTSSGVRSPGSSVGSIMLGSSPLSNVVFRNYNNIYIGNNINASARISVNNSMIIGNQIDMTGTVDNVLAIHNSKAIKTDLANSLIYGEFDNRKLRINGSLSINPTYISDAQDDVTYNKVIVGKSDGTLGWENKGTVNAFTAAVTVGGIKAGTIIPAGTDLQQFITMLFTEDSK